MRVINFFSLFLCYLYKIRDVLFISFQNLNKESADPRWKPGVQARANKGVRGNYSRYSSHGKPYLKGKPSQVLLELFLYSMLVSVQTITLIWIIFLVNLENLGGSYIYMLMLISHLKPLALVNNSAGFNWFSTYLS